MPVTLPTGMGGPVGHACTYPRNPVSHTAASKLHPVLDEFLLRGNCKREPVQKVCLGGGGRYKRTHEFPNTMHERQQAVDRVEWITYSLVVLTPAEPNVQEGVYPTLDH